MTQWERSLLGPKHENMSCVSSSPSSGFHEEPIAPLKVIRKLHWKVTWTTASPLGIP